MEITRRDVLKIGITAGLVAKLGWPTSASAENKSGYNNLIPNLNGEVPYEKGYLDVSSKIPGNETYVERFRLSNGTVAIRLSIDGQVYAYHIREANSAKGTGLRDPSGDGIFSEKYSSDETLSVPDWLIRKKTRQ